MAKETSLQITSYNATLAKEVQRKIQCANPNASNYVLKTFAEKLNDLTTNTFKKVDRVDTEDITNATNGGEG